jgi:FAD/FMN-containing dehydrogenase
VSTTGIAGLTLGGGLGWLMGKCGLACDNLVQAEVVCADGSVVIANESEHADLFWGLRGGGGNFGVVTRFEYRLHPLQQVVAGMILYPMTRAAEVLRCYRDCTAEASDELTAMGALLTTPDLQPAVGAIVCHCGDAAEAQRALRPLRSVGGALADTIGPMPYIALQTMLDATTPPGRYNYWKASFAPTLDDGLITELVAGTAAIPSPLSSVLIEHLHGAVSRVGAADTAFGVRQTQYSIGIFSAWEDVRAQDTNVDWTQGLNAAVRPFSGERSYVNYLADANSPQLRAAFGANYERLTDVKARYDRDNFFRVNFNIPPRKA